MIHRLVVATAGHVDHGKTSVIQALTGTDCDRLAEEKARGITIDLGFAGLRSGDLQVGFVDVPGHQRFVHNALAGLAGAGVMLLIVAADEGVRPQTREHVAICSLLGIRQAIVVMNKVDLVDAELRELAELDIAEFLISTPFATAPVLPVSARSGEGIAGLRDRLLSMARASGVPENRPARLPVDRVFQLRGLGAVVTGTLMTGRIQCGDVLQTVPGDETVRVRSIQVHGESRPEAVAGERTSLQVTGLELAALGRGVQLVTPSTFEPTSTIFGRFIAAPDVRMTKSRVRVRFHLLSAEKPAVARLTPAKDERFVEIRLSEPIGAIRGDRFVVYQESPPTLIGGGEVLDPQCPPVPLKELATMGAALGDSLERAWYYWLDRAGDLGLTTADLARRIGSHPGPVASQLAALRSTGTVVSFGDGARDARWITCDVFNRIAARATSVLTEYFAHQSLVRGMPKAEALARVFGSSHAEESAERLFHALGERNVIAIDGEVVDLPTRKGELLASEAQILETIMERFCRAGLQAPTVNDLIETLETDRAVIDRALARLVERQRLVRLAPDEFVPAAAVTGVCQALGRLAWPAFTVSQFKSEFGLTRRIAVPLLEHLDALGVTQRIGNERQIVHTAL